MDIKVIKVTIEKADIFMGERDGKDVYFDSIDVEMEVGGQPVTYLTMRGDDGVVDVEGAQWSTTWSWIEDRIERRRVRAMATLAAQSSIEATISLGLKGEA